MNNTTDIKDYATLEKVLQGGIDGSIKIEQSQLMTLVSVFYALHQELSSLFKKESDNDVLYTHSISNNVDFLVEESFSRAKCVELFLHIIENKKSMLQTLKNAGIAKPQSSNSGCMIVLFVVLSLCGMTLLS